MEHTTLLPLRTKECCGFLSPSAAFEPANLRSNGKHANHYTTEDDSGTFKIAENKHCYNKVAVSVLKMKSIHVVCFVKMNVYLYECVYGKAKKTTRLYRHKFSVLSTCHNISDQNEKEVRPYGVL
jgi:hypothetical protein